MPIREPETHELTRFLGVNLRRDRLGLADEEVARAVNADFHRFLGVIAIRRGSSRLLTLAAGHVHSIARINGRRYFAANRTWYRNSGAIATTLDSDRFVAQVGYRPLNDEHIWAFLADRNGMRKDNGVATYAWGITAPTVKPRVRNVSAPGTSLAGGYSTRYSYVRETSDGKVAAESNPSPTSATLDLKSGEGRGPQVIEMAAYAPSDPQVTHLYFYRTVGDGVQHLLHGKIAVTAIVPPAESPGQLGTEDPTSAEQVEDQADEDVDPTLWPTTIAEYGPTTSWETDLLYQVPVRYTNDCERAIATTLLSRVERTTYVISTTTGQTGTARWEKTWSATTITTISVQLDTGATRLASATQITRTDGVSAQPIQAFETELLTDEVVPPDTGQVGDLPTGQITAVTLGGPDSNLGRLVATNNDPPPACGWATIYQEHAFLTRNAANPHWLYYSKRWQPEAVPLDNVLEIGNADDPIQSAVPLGGLLGIFTRRTKYILSGSVAPDFAHAESLSRRGTRAGRSVVPTQDGLMFCADDGVFLTTLVGQDQELSTDIAALFYGETVNGFAPINWDAGDTICAAFHQGRYYLALPTGSNAAPELLAVFSTATGKWYFWSLGVQIRSLFEEVETDALLAGAITGVIYRLDDGVDDQTVPIAMEVETRDFAPARAWESRRLFRWARLDVDTDGDAITVDLYVDGTLRRTTTLTDARTKALIPFPGGSLGYTWRVRVRYTGRRAIRIYGVSVVWLPLEVA
jgi:hypothetical protein